MQFVLEFIAIMTIGVLPSLISVFLDLTNPAYLKKAEHFSVFETLPSIWVSALGSISVVLLVAYQQPNGFASIGIQSGKWGNNILAILVGYFSLIFFVLLFALGQKIILLLLKQSSPPALDTSNPWVTSNLRYQDNWERFADLTLLPFTAISEDLIYRGYLVLFLGRLTNTLIPWAIISIFLMVLLHLYQGRNIRMITFHVLLAILFTVLTIATQNILAPITAHIIFNLVSKLRLWRLGKKQDPAISRPGNSNIKKFAYTLFGVANIFIFVVSSVIVLV